MNQTRRAKPKSALALFGGPETVTLDPPPYPAIGPGEAAAVVQTLLERQLSGTGPGGVVAEMEAAYADYFGARYALACNSGTAAIASALFAVDVKPGTEVLTASNTWISAITAICHAGGTPVFCDVKRGAHHIDPAEIRRKAGPHTRALIATHLWGQPADMDPIMAAAKEANLAVVEDCSHAHGGMYKGRYLGTIGDVGCFSLQASKAIVAGEGGVLITDSRRCYQRAMVPGAHGVRLSQELALKELEPFKQGGGSWTYRISPLCAALGRAQLPRLDTLNAARQANFDRLRSRLRKVEFIRWPRLASGSVRGWYGTPAFYQYDQRKVSRDLFCQACQAEGAPVRGNGYENWYQVPLFQDPRLYAQLWPVKHENGVEYRPLDQGALANNEALRQEVLLFAIPAEECPQLMDQIGAAIEKVAASMSQLAKRTR